MATTTRKVKIETPKFELDTLDLQIQRSMVLLAAKPAMGKSYSVVKLVLDGKRLGFNVFVIDRDRGLADEIRTQCGGKIPDNLQYKLARKWTDMEGALDYAFETLEPQDWLVFEHVGRLWDFAQEDYTKEVYGKTMAQRLRVLRSEAEELIREGNLDLNSKSGKDEAGKIRSRGVGYQGLDGRKDWAVIKSAHNGDIFDRVLLDGHFNVLSTTSVTGIDRNDENSIKLWSEWATLGVRPEGEKHQRYRHSTVAYAYRKGKQFLWRTDLGADEGKDRGRDLVKDVDMTDVGFVRSWAEYHGIWAPSAPAERPRKKIVVKR